jgi:hypothetical protein
MDGGGLVGDGISADDVMRVQQVPLLCREINRGTGGFERAVVLMLFEQDVCFCVGHGGPLRMN